MAKKKSVKDFILEANALHHDKYDYSKVLYTSTHTKVLIKCKTCGLEFWQEPASHLSGRGCPKCGRLQRHLRITPAQFFQQAEVVHKGKYDYSKSEYIDMHTKINIICPKHGMFSQNAQSHLEGHGCPKCKAAEASLREKYTTDFFIKKAREVHGEKYDYSKVDYKGWNIKVKIICPIHGEFLQSPSDHLKGHGCVHCGNSQDYKKLSNKEFETRARKIHGDKYDYSRFIYRNSTSKGLIKCPLHGYFWQTPNDHLSGCGCPKCKDLKTKLRFQSNRDDFIKKARVVHGDFYDYSKVVYVDSKTKVTIVCPKHGNFLQTPNAHLHNYGCPKCGLEKTIASHISDSYSFIEKAKVIHGEKYDYSKVNYIRNNKKVCIICPKHGIFWQTPNSHLLGNGCHKCKQTKGEEQIELYLKKHDIVYIPEYAILHPYPHRRLFRVDFWLPKSKSIIEYNGLQHYKPIKYMGGEQKLAQRRVRDAELKEYCRANRIGLLIIPYTEYKNIESVLDKFINK